MELHPEIRSRLTGFKPASYEELLSLCVEIESDRKMMRTLWEAKKNSSKKKVTSDVSKPSTKDDTSKMQLPKEKRKN